MSIDNKLSFKIIKPIVTGTYNTSECIGKPNESNQQSFDDMLKTQLSGNLNINFSKHAQKRIEERAISLDNQSIKKLENAIDKADSKGIKDTLIIFSNNAFIANTKSRTIVTAISSDELKDNVFTNIDGTVLV